MAVPKDPVILLSYVNTKLRDAYPSLEAFCENEMVDKETLVNTLQGIDYAYDEVTNQFK